MKEDEVRVRQLIIRHKYNITCRNYDELYGEEQYEKYSCAFSKLGTPSSIVLDDGCGTGLLLEYLSEINGLQDVSYYICLDLTPCMIDLAKKRVNQRKLGHLVDLVEADAEHLPLRNNAVAQTYSFTVMDLLQNPDKGVKEAVRVSREIIVVSSLKKTSSSYTRSSITYYGVKICETDKDNIFVRKVEKHAQPVDPSSR